MGGGGAYNNDMNYNNNGCQQDHQNPNKDAR